MTVEQSTSAPEGDQKLDDVSDADIWNELEAADNAAPEDEPSRAELVRDEDDSVKEPEGSKNAGSEKKPVPEEFTPSLETQQEDSTPPDSSNDNPLESENSRLKKTNAGQSRKINNLIREKEALEARLAASKSEDAEGRKEALEEVALEYEDIVGPVIDHVRDLGQQVETLRGNTADRIAEIDSNLREAYQAEAAILLAEEPDALTFVQNNFKTIESWVDDQPRAIRDAWAANQGVIRDGQGALSVVRAFKQAAGQAGAKLSTTSRRQRQLDGARATTGGAQRPATSHLPSNSTDDQAHWDYWEERDRREGRL